MPKIFTSVFIKYVKSSSSSRIRLLFVRLVCTYFYCACPKSNAIDVLVVEKDEGTNIYLIRCDGSNVQIMQICFPYFFLLQLSSEWAAFMPKHSFITVAAVVLLCWKNDAAAAVVTVLCDFLRFCCRRRRRWINSSTITSASICIHLSKGIEQNEYQNK